ncbi:TPA: Mth938-like domain-containing protein, partial [Legionella pneumophila]
MNINLETAEQHAVQAYSDKKIQINSIIYESSLIVSKKE